MDWQPIETAPDDGTRFLGYWPDRWGNSGDSAVTTWRANDGDGWESPYESAEDGEMEGPTHWMPLPPPSASKGNRND
jgi:hypothetical protein